ncbi:MFS transporter [Candidatus Solincola sp.]|nr:MFS transporter [Actinomycetota bacterium]MDI7252574.1 MFS transporter [Actinomycetota bacterium]
MEGPEERLMTRGFLLVCASNFLAFFAIYMVIPILPVFLEERGYSNAFIGFLMSVATMVALLRPFFGRLADDHGRKRLLATGTLLLGLSTFFYASFSTAVPLLIIRFLNGCGLAAFHTAAYAMVGDLAPPSRRLQAIAIFYISVDVSIALAPPAAKALRLAWGYTPAYLLAGVIAALSFLSSLLVPETMTATATGRNGRAKTGFTPLQKAIFAATMGFTLTFGSLQTFIVLSSQSKGVGQGELFFTVFAATLIAFRLGMGKKADRINRRHLVLASGLMTLVGLAMLAYANSLALLLSGSLVYAIGFAYLPTTLSALLLDHTPQEMRGRALGMFMAVFDVGIGLGGIALGPVADSLGYPPMYLLGGALAASTLVYFYARTVGIALPSAQAAATIQGGKDE